MSVLELLRARYVGHSLVCLRDVACESQIGQSFAFPRTRRDATLPLLTPPPLKKNPSCPLNTPSTVQNSGILAQQIEEIWSCRQAPPFISDRVVLEFGRQALPEGASWLWTLLCSAPRRWPSDQGYATSIPRGRQLGRYQAQQCHGTIQWWQSSERKWWLGRGQSSHQPVRTQPEKGKENTKMKDKRTAKQTKKLPPSHPIYKQGGQTV